MHHLNYDRRSELLYAALCASWWGNDLQVRRSWGKSWRKASHWRATRKYSLRQVAKGESGVSSKQTITERQPV
ncbi:MAG: hypothetical protein ACE5H2_02120 [Terriglobia bacterium]